jgi:hypothetical protein
MCAYNASAFVMQAAVHFPFMNDDAQTYEDNARITAYFYVIPLLGEIATAWSNFDGWYPVMPILLVIGWFLCLPNWYYQVQLSGGEGYNASSQEEALIMWSRARASVWVVRLVTLCLWVGLNM